MPNEAIATEADVAGWRSLDMLQENTDRAAGKVAEANERASSRATREAQVRLDIGVPAPTPIGPEERELNDVGKTSLPVAYRADLSNLTLSEAGHAELKAGLPAMAAAHQLDHWLGDGLIANCINALGTVKGMSDEEKLNYYTRNELLIFQRAGGEAQGKARIKIAQDYLMKGGHVAEGVAKHLAYDPLVCEICFNFTAVKKT